MSLRALLWIVALVTVAVVGGWAAGWLRPVPTVSGALPQQAYLWQRQWTPQVRAAVAQKTPLAELCVSYAEIGAGAPPVVERTAGLDWPTLARCPQPVGFAIRVREFPGEVSVAREPFGTLQSLVRELCVAARAAGVQPAEIQVDFDCPTSRLRGFAAWLRALRQSFPDQTFRFTALPAWLWSRDFAPLAREAGGYILQLHWLEKPGSDGRPATTLCDPTRARAAVDRAARLGVPFRTALPTYGYRLVLDARGRLLAAAGEGAALEAARPPPGGSVRTLGADPAALADLIHGWQDRHPAALQGVIWYRLPVPGDRLNWTARTLWAVAAGRRPQTRLTLQFTRNSADGPCELRLRNDGDADAPLPTSIAVHCATVPLAVDAVGGYELRQNAGSAQELVFLARTPLQVEPRTLPPDASLEFGWVRLADDGSPPGPVETRLTGALTSAAAASPNP